MREIRSNLKQRQDLKLSPAVTEDFYYDALNRFDYSTRKLGAGSPAINADVTLDAIGNISWKQGIGNYSYHATKRRAVVAAGGYSFGYDANGNMTSRNGANIGYTSYNLPNVINAPGGYSSTLSYGAFRNRYKQVAIGAQGTETTITVAGLLEKVSNGSGTHYRHYIQGGNGTAAIHSRTVGGSNATFYLHRDHLGSPELITDATGNALVRPSYSAYGERRDGADWDGPISATDLATLAGISRRGFTGHEHLDAVNLIHMNGRVYEPIVGRFLSIDPIVHVGLGQSPNSYSYVWNNPLSLIDPSGFQPDGGGGLPPVLDCTGGFPCTFVGYFRPPRAIYVSPHPSKDARTPATEPDPPIRFPSTVGGSWSAWNYFGISSADAADIHARQSQSMPITDLERAIAAAGDVEGFWKSRQAQSDPLADVALDSLRPSEGVIDYLFGGESINNRLEAFSRVYAGSSVDIAAVRLDLMNAHIAAVDADRQGVLGLLSPGQVYDYHRDVFARYGLPATTFGGSPFTGARWEASATRVFWCPRCDR